MIKKICANCIKNKYGTCDKWNMTASAFCFMPSEEAEEENSMGKQVRQSAEELVGSLALILGPLPVTWSAGNKTVDVNLGKLREAADLLIADRQAEREACAKWFCESKCLYGKRDMRHKSCIACPDYDAILNPKEE